MTSASGINFRIREVKMFKEAFWIKRHDEVWRFKCADAVYAWVWEEGTFFHYRVVLSYRFQTQMGRCLDLESAKELAELMVLSTKTTLKQQMETKGLAYSRQ